MSSQILFPFKIQIVCVFAVELQKFFIYFENKLLIRSMIFKYVFPFWRLPFHFVDGFLCYADAFEFDIPSFVYFCFCCLGSWVSVLKKSYPRPMLRCLPPIYSRSFAVSYLRLKSLIYFEFFCVYHIRQWSSLILLHMIVVFPTTFIEETFLSPL